MHALINNDAWFCLADINIAVLMHYYYPMLIFISHDSFIRKNGKPRTPCSDEKKKVCIRQKFHRIHINRENHSIRGGLRERRSEGLELCLRQEELASIP